MKAGLREKFRYVPKTNAQAATTYFRLGTSLVIFHPKPLSLAKDPSQRPNISSATSPN